jgi:uncharacterized protein (DUF3084 family)
MEAEQNRLVEKESSLVQGMSNLREQTALLEQREKSINEREDAHLSQSKKLGDAKALMDKEKDDLQSKASDIIAREAVLAKAIESSKHTEDGLRRKEATLISLEESLQAKENKLVERSRALDARLADVSARETLVEQSHALKSRIQQEKEKLDQLQSSCQDESAKLQQLRDEAGNLRPVLTEAVRRFEKESKELEDITRRKQVLSREVSFL